MLEPILHNTLNKRKIVLASSSPRRKEILSSVKLKFEVVTPKFEENLNASNYNNHFEYAIDTAYHKVCEVEERLKKQSKEADLIIGADTIVSLNGKIYEKPVDSEDAKKLLSELSGKQHSVFSGLVLKTKKDLVKFHHETLVTMSPLSEAVINAYVQSGEPMDKAGAYGIQGVGGSLIEKIDGDFFNVMGLPLNRICKELLKLYGAESEITETVST